MKIVPTRDASFTLYIPELDETYHSRNGAMEEALYVYIGRGLEDRLQHGLNESVAMLEIGFGTGLNAWLTAIKCTQLQQTCIYHSLETVPLSTDIIGQLNYTQNATEDEQQLFTQLHQCVWNQPETINTFFTLQKIESSLQHFQPTQQYDIIYFDAFAPDKQPELWTEICFQKLFDCLNPGGFIVTYSSKGDVKRLWKQIGFEVERLPGPPFKRHMLRGKK